MTGATDDAFTSALDRFQTADCERTDASIAEDRERRTHERTSRMRSDLDQRMTGQPSGDQPQRPVYEGFRDSNNVIDWERFRAAVADWDDAHTKPGAVQDPFNNRPGG
jgi:hypothetical protein